ncbi:MAG: hypothetical protein O2887_09125 [Bacteroidetes bacterium]|nr:hypothetical protein [Bacteroidota bacterium]
MAANKYIITRVPPTNLDKLLSTPWRVYEGNTSFPEIAQEIRKTTNSAPTPIPDFTNAPGSLTA